MSGTTTTIVIFGVICLCVGAIYIAQARENARLDKLRKINYLNERYKQMQCLLYDLPPQYLNNELRIMITERSIETLTELNGLKNDARLTAQIQQDQDFLKQLREQNPEFKPVKVKDEVAAKEVRKLLEILFRFVQSQHKRKMLDAASTKTYLGHISFYSAQSSADLFARIAEEANKAGKPRVAIHNFHSAIAAFKDLSNIPQAVQAINHYRAQIKTLESVADEHNQKVKNAAQDKLEDSQEWDKYLDDDGGWKKKNNYDD